MPRPSPYWLLFAACVAVLFGGMGWATRSALRQEQERFRAEHENQLRERARLALWRMDSRANAILVEESARSPEQYRAFSRPSNFVWTGNASGLGSVRVPSPLLDQQPPYVFVHFEFGPDGTLHSPQVPDGPVPRGAVVSSEAVAKARQRLSELDAILAGRSLPAPKMLVESRPESQTTAPAQAPTKLAPDSSQQIVQANQAESKLADLKQMLREQNRAEESTEAAPGSSAGLGGSKPVSKALAATAAAPAMAQKDSAASRQAIAQQYSDADQQAREYLMKRTKESFVRNTKTAASSLKKSLPQEKADLSKPAKKEQSGPGLQPSTSPPVPEPAASSVREMQPDLVGGVVAVGPISAFWVRDALLLTRRVESKTEVWVQGAWIDWAALEAELLDLVRDLFPDAKLRPHAPLTSEAVAASGFTPVKNDPAAAGEFRLVSLPVELVPGSLPEEPMRFWTPLKTSLAAAWGGAFFLATGIGIALAALLSLNERRGAFVSAVTHELRTPLATFRLYSEMLEDGMVPDEERRREYLRTLTREAGRLSHLVENVLAYARLERNRFRRQIESVEVRALIERIEGRLRERTESCGAALRIDLVEDLQQCAVQTDVSAVEQILFNLVDNACKYGRGPDDPAHICLKATREGRCAVFRVCDSGPGLSAEARRTLFQPFRKSATQAANSAPGVGLGLALCRRLARQLGGDLMHEPQPKGACFSLRLPSK